MTYAVKLDAYEGPLDLLLQLVSRERVDVAEISISTLTEEYLKATSALGEVDLETATGFLVLAATLLEIKSIKLLPQRKAADPEIKVLLEERDALLKRLISYSTFRAAAVRLGTALEEGAGFVSRDAEFPEELIPDASDVFANLTAEQLAEAAARALVPRAEMSVDTSHITRVTVSLEEMVREMTRRISAAGVSSFRHLCANLRKLEAAISFLALLELYRNRAIDLEQRGPFEPIRVTWKQPPLDEWL